MDAPVGARAGKDDEEIRRLCSSARKRAHDESSAQQLDGRGRRSGGANRAGEARGGREEEGPSGVASRAERLQGCEAPGAADRAAGQDPGVRGHARSAASGGREGRDAAAGFDDAPTSSNPPQPRPLPPGSRSAHSPRRIVRLVARGRYAEALGFSRHFSPATPAAVRTAYRRQALALHPDRAGTREEGGNVTGAFAALSKARDALLEDLEVGAGEDRGDLSSAQGSAEEVEPSGGVGLGRGREARGRADEEYFEPFWRPTRDRAVCADGVSKEPRGGGIGTAGHGRTRCATSAEAAFPLGPSPAAPLSTSPRPSFPSGPCSAFSPDDEDLGALSDAALSSLASELREAVLEASPRRKAPLRARLRLAVAEQEARREADRDDALGAGEQGRRKGAGEAVAWTGDVWGGGDDGGEGGGFF